MAENPGVAGLPDDEPTIIYSEAVYGAATREPLVKITLGDESITCSSDDARRVGADIITTAHAADADAFLVEFLQEKIGMPIETAANILFDFREWRFKKGPSFVTCVGERTGPPVCPDCGRGAE